MQQGDCFYGKFPKSATIEPHFWFVLTNPDEKGQVIVVNVTTPKSSGDNPAKAQILKKSDCPCLRYDSAIYWKGVGPRLSVHIESAIRAKAFTPHPPLSASKIKEMVAEGEVLCLIPRETLSLLKKAGL